MAPQDIIHPWRCWQVETTREASVQGHLLHNDVTAYTPLLKELRRYRKGKVVVETAVFPGYCFAQFDLSRADQLRDVVPGLIRLIGIGPRPSEISDAEIDHIRRMTAPAPSLTRGRQVIASWPQIVRGRRVRVTIGRYAGLEGIFDRLTDDDDRVWVNIDMLGCARGVLVDRAMVEPL